MKFLSAILILLNKRKYILLFLYFLFIFTLFAEEKEKSNSINLKCLSCHSLESTREGKLKIYEKYFFSSVHASLKCTDCHQVTLRDTEEDIPHKKYLPDVNCISKCHQVNQQIKPGLSPIYYPDGVHGKAYLERGIKDIWPADDLLSKINPANLAKTCGQENCHSGMPDEMTKPKIHSNPNQRKSKNPYFVKLILLWTIFVAAVIIIWFVPKFIRKIK